MWSQIIKAGQQLLLTFMQWAQLYGIPMALAVVLAWVMGMDQGLTGQKLRLKIAGSLIVAYVGTPLVIYALGLAPSIWAAFIATFLSYLSLRAYKWVELLLLREMGIDRRHSKDEQI